MSENLIAIIIYSVFLIGFGIVLFLMFRSPKIEQKDKIIGIERADTNVLVAMHTFYKSSGEYKKANEIAVQLNKRGFTYEGSEDPDVGVWTKND